MGELLQNSETFKAPNAAKVDGSEYILDLQAGFFNFSKSIEHTDNGLAWYAKATIPSTDGWAGSSSLYLNCYAHNNPFRIKLTIPRVSTPDKYYGLGVSYGSPSSLEAFALYFDSSSGNNTGTITIYFKFIATCINATIKCSNINSTFEIISEPSEQSWIDAAGVHNTL